MDPFVSKANRSRYIMVGAAFGVVIVVAVLVVGMVVYNYTSYQSSAGLPSGEVPSSQVSIGSPQDGIQLDVDESLLIKATAIGPKAFLSMELWVDGALAGVQSAPSGGARPLTTYFYWLPKVPGYHSLIATGIDVDGLKTLSAQVVVYVNPFEDAEETLSIGQNISPVVLPLPAGGGYVPPSPPGADDSVGPADVWSGSPGDWVNSFTVDGKPIAPELVVSAERCGVNLLIHDLSDNEEGFIIFRQTPNSPEWQQVAILSSQSQNDWLTYADDGLAGAFTYYVSAFNSQGESASNLALVNINPAECPDEPTEVTGIEVEVTRLMPELMVDKSYCYVSTDGLSWTRWPQFGFLEADEDGYVTGGPIIQLLPNGLDGQQATPRLGINMECWGWQGEILMLLGDFFVEADDKYPKFLGTQLVAGNGIQAEVLFDPVEIVKEGDFYPIGPGSNLGSDFMLEKDKMVPRTWIGPELPTPSLYQTTDTEFCGGHVPPHAQNPAGRAYYCFVYPEFDPAHGSISTQPYLFWTFGFGSTFTCLAGSGDDCISYTELLTLAEGTGGLVGFEVTSVSNAGALKWSVTEPRLTMFVVPPMDCTGDANYGVRLWYRPGPEDLSIYTIGGDSGAAVDPDSSSFTEQDQPEVDSEDGSYTVGGDGPVATVQEVFYSLPSNWVTIPCIPPNVNTTVTTEYSQKLDITFKSLSMSALDDGDSDPQDVEVYGYFRVVAPSMGEEIVDMCQFSLPGLCDDGDLLLSYQRRYLNLATWNEQGDSCPDEVEEDLIKDLLNISTIGWTYPPALWFDYENAYRAFGCPHTLLEGGYDLTSLYMCQATTKYECKLEGTATDYAFNNNTLRVFVKEGDALALEVKFVDWDDASDNDLVCEGVHMMPSKSLNEWANTHESFQIITSTTDSGQCSVQVEINAVTP